MSIEFPNLPYADDALEPHISTETLRLHHGRHHRGYVEESNCLPRSKGFVDESLEVIVAAYAQHSATNKEAASIVNSAAPAWNHAFYWQSLPPPGGRAPEGALAVQIAMTFDDLCAHAQTLLSEATGHFGSAWAWLVVDRGTFKIAKTANADTPIVHGLTPLLVIDVWEHAYYLDRHDRRASLVAAVIDYLLDRRYAEANISKAPSGRAALAPPRSARVAAPLHA